MTRDEILLIAKRMIEERGGSQIDDEEELLRFAVVLGNRVAAELRRHQGGGGGEMTQPKALFLADVIEADPASKSHHVEAAAELRHLHGMVKGLSATCDELKDALAAGCDEGRDQLWESGGAAGCSRALSAEFQRDALLEALKKIAAIKNKMWGTDWEEIDEARGIARAAIAKAEGEKT